jgi:hypothetical protein
MAQQMQAGAEGERFNAFKELLAVRPLPRRSLSSDVDEVNIVILPADLRGGLNETEVPLQRIQ